MATATERMAAVTAATMAKAAPMNELVESSFEESFVGVLLVLSDTSSSLLGADSLSVGSAGVVSAFLKLTDRVISSFGKEGTLFTIHDDFDILYRRGDGVNYLPFGNNHSKRNFITRICGDLI